MGYNTMSIQWMVHGENSQGVRIGWGISRCEVSNVFFIGLMWFFEVLDEGRGLMIQLFLYQDCIISNLFHILNMMFGSHWVRWQSEGVATPRRVYDPAVHNSRGGLRTAGEGNKTRSRKSMNGGLGMGTTAMGWEYCHQQERTQQQRTFSNNKWVRECYCQPSPSFLLCPCTTASRTKNNAVCS